MKENRLGFNFYRSYAEIALELAPDDRLAFYDALIARQFTGAEPDLKGLAKFAYISQKHSIDKQVKGYERVKNCLLSKSEPPVGSLPPPPPLQVQEEVQEKEKEKEQWFIGWFNSSMTELKGSGKYKLNKKIKAQLHARIKEGYKGEDFIKAFNSIANDDFHKGKNHKHLTPEFITRVDKLEMWCNVKSEIKETNNAHLFQS